MTRLLKSSRGRLSSFAVGFLLFSVICSNCLLASHEKKILGDRLLLEINHSAFSQRQMEIYLAVKHALKDDSRTPEFTDAKNWYDALDIYRQDMLIFQEVRRQGHFQPTKEQLEKATAAVTAKMQASPALRALDARLGIGEHSLMKACSDTLQIAEYRRIKDKSLEKDWLKKLERRSVVRFFKGTEEYRLIEPQPLAGAAKKP